jgi:tetratricopeptide (TPR) repeat protein
MYRLLWLTSFRISVGSVEEEATIYNMREIIDSNPSLNCFESSFCHLETYRLGAEGSWISARVPLEKGITIAERCEDWLQLTKMYVTMAYCIRSWDTKKAMEFVSKAERLYEKLGLIPANEVYNVYGLVSNVMGEFDNSVRYFDQGVENSRKKHLAHSPGSLPFNMSSTCFEMGLYKDSLEWVMMAEESFDIEALAMNPVKKMTDLRKAAAYAALGHMTEAEDHLLKAKDQGERIGTVHFIGEDHYVTGILEQAAGNWENAILSFTQAKTVFESIPEQDGVNKCLYRLAQSDSVIRLEGENPWITKLEEISREKSHAGYLGLALLLKADLMLNQQRIDETKLILEEVVEISNKPGCNFLQRMVVELFDRTAKTRT